MQCASWLNVSDVNNFTCQAFLSNVYFVLFCFKCCMRDVQQTFVTLFSQRIVILIESTHIFIKIEKNLKPAVQDFSNIFMSSLSLVEGAIEMYHSETVGMASWYLLLLISSFLPEVCHNDRWCPYRRSGVTSMVPAGTRSPNGTTLVALGPVLKIALRWWVSSLRLTSLIIT